jgi:hypothetical protein
LQEVNPKRNSRVVSAIAMGKFRVWRKETLRQTLGFSAIAQEGNPKRNSRVVSAIARGKFRVCRKETLRQTLGFSAISHGAL